MTATPPAAPRGPHHPANVGPPDEAHLECRTCHIAWPCPDAPRRPTAPPTPRRPDAQPVDVPAVDTAQG